MEIKHFLWMFLICACYVMTRSCTPKKPVPIKCADIVEDNGRVCYDTNPKSAIIVCNKHYTLNGTGNNTNCTRHANNWAWSHPIPTCVWAVSDSTPTSSKFPVTISTTEDRPGSIGNGSLMNETTSDEDSTKTTDQESDQSSSPRSGQSVADDENQTVTIVIPLAASVIVIAGAIAIFLLWRKSGKTCFGFRNKKSEHPVPTTHNIGYEQSDIERLRSLSYIQNSESDDSGYVDIPLDDLHSDETSTNVYQTIDGATENNLETRNEYGQVKKQSASFIDMTYSHINGNQTAGKDLNDLTYSHTENTVNVKEQKGTPVDCDLESDTTYNRLGSKHMPDNKFGKFSNEEEKREYPDYNHAKAGLTFPHTENKTDAYSHINRSPAKPPSSKELFIELDSKTKQGEANEIKDTDLSKQPQVQPYEFSKETENFQYEFAKDIDATAHGNTIVGSENVKGANSYKSVSEGYGQVVGTTHDYFVLEPEKGTSCEKSACHVADESTKENHNTAEREETPYHQYFILENM